MVEAGHCLGLALKTGAVFGSLRHPRRKNLERHFAIKFLVFGKVDLAHSASSKAFFDAVVAESFANHLPSVARPFKTGSAVLETLLALRVNKA